MMKSTGVLLLMVWALFIGCTTKDPLPADRWSEGCVELAPYSAGYRLSGICCSYILLPTINLNRDHNFSVKAEYYTFNGASFVAIPTVINGQLSPDGKVLTITYLLNSTVTTHVLQAGQATVSCHCGCD